MTFPSDKVVSRRVVVASASSLLSALSCFKVFAATPDNKSVKANRVYVQLRGASDISDTLWLYSGAFWAKPYGETARQLFKVEGLSFNKTALKADGGVEESMTECGFWLDLETRDLVDEWVNPLNDLLCHPVHFKAMGSHAFDQFGDLVVRERNGFGAHHVSGKIDEPVINGSVIWSKQHTITKFIRPEPNPGDDPLLYNGPMSTLASIVTYTGSVSDLEKEFVPATMYFQSMLEWYPWMRMGQRPGTCSFALSGRKIVALDEAPERLLGFINARRPGFLENPWL